MDISAVITQTLGIIFTVMGISVIIDKKNVSAALEKVTQDRGFLWLWSFLILTMGAVIIAINDAQFSGLSLLITILGWLTIIKGAFLMFLPGPAVSLYQKCNKDGILIFGGIVAFILGLILLYLGFMY